MSTFDPAAFIAEVSPLGYFFGLWDADDKGLDILFGSPFTGIPQDCQGDDRTRWETFREHEAEWLVHLVNFARKQGADTASFDFKNPVCLDSKGVHIITPRVTLTTQGGGWWQQT